MAHEIAYINGRFSFARAADAGEAWHESETMTSDQIILPGDSRETILRKSGLNYTVQSVPLYYRPECDRPAAGQPAPKARTVPGKVAQVRDDTGDSLGIVGDGFHTVQPCEAYDVAAEWCDRGSAKLETIFALHGGRLYGALFCIGEAVSLDNGKDTLKPYLYWSTACDGTRSTQIKNTAIRVECANTDRMTRGDRAQFSKSHRSAYDASEARECVELAIAEFGAYVTMARTLATVKVDADKAAAMTAELVGPAKTPAGRVSTAHARILELFQGAGAGSQLVTTAGTAWGYLNAVTDYADHDMRATSADNRFDSAQSGNGDALKSRARELVEAL
jgi:phage/plasmid-like protein (TIGR03299 family)